MKKDKLKYLNNIIKPAGIYLQRIKEQEIQKTYIKFLENISLFRFRASSKKKRIKENTLDVNIIIFSKDRALQLFSLLESFYANVLQPAKIHILYAASNPEHAEAYTQVEKLFLSNGIIFIKEQKFREDLIKIVRSLSVSKLIFLVDDIIFTEPIDLENFININTDKFVASLRMGDHLDFCYTLQQQQPLPSFITIQRPYFIDKIVWKWKEGTLDWNYPLSVDGHLFSVGEINHMFSLIDFKAPNSLEEAMQVFKPFYLRKLGIAYKKARIVNIPCNKVQLENDNISEEITVDFLLQKWKSGYQIDNSLFKHFNNKSAHQFVPFRFIKRS